ncbi:hypothetical protein JW826_03855 [Candidatus Woesearchaeota archaeon]|nr:hypothetical protein [Candidatus Woesearchaeota archaeon]
MISFKKNKRIGRFIATAAFVGLAAFGLVRNYVSPPNNHQRQAPSAYVSGTRSGLSARVNDAYNAVGCDIKTANRAKIDVKTLYDGKLKTASVYDAKRQASGVTLEGALGNADVKTSYFDNSWGKRHMRVSVFSTTPGSLLESFGFRNRNDQHDASATVNVNGYKFGIGGNYNSSSGRWSFSFGRA